MAVTDCVNAHSTFVPGGRSGVKPTYHSTCACFTTGWAVTPFLMHLFPSKNGACRSNNFTYLQWYSVYPRPRSITRMYWLIIETQDVTSHSCVTSLYSTFPSLRHWLWLAAGRAVSRIHCVFLEREMWDGWDQVYIPATFNLNLTRCPTNASLCAWRQWRIHRKHAWILCARSQLPDFPMFPCAHLPWLYRMLCTDDPIQVSICLHDFFSNMGI